MDHAVSRLLAHDRIRAARHHIERTDEVTLARQAALSAIPAPTGAEGRRAAHLAELFREIGLSDVSIDHAGNVQGWFARNGDTSAGPVVVAAHLDTVFGAEADVAVERRGQRLEGPGISDNARGLAALVAVAEAMVAARVPAAPRTPRTRSGAPWRCWPTSGPRRPHAPPAPWSVSAEGPASPRSRRRRGSTWTSAARMRARCHSSPSPCARRSSAPPTTRTAAARPARRRCAPRSGSWATGRPA